MILTLNLLNPSRLSSSSGRRGQMKFSIVHLHVIPNNWRATTGGKLTIFSFPLEDSSVNIYSIDWIIPSEKQIMERPRIQRLQRGPDRREHVSACIRSVACPVHFRNSQGFRLRIRVASTLYCELNSLNTAGSYLFAFFSKVLGVYLESSPLSPPCRLPVGSVTFQHPKSLPGMPAMIIQSARNTFFRST